MLALQLNLSLVHLRTQQWEAAVDSAAAVLQLDPAQPKALYRRGIARAQLGEHVGARHDLRAALAASTGRSGRAEVQRALDGLSAALAVEEQEEREAAAMAHLKQGIEQMPDEQVSMESCVRAMAKMARAMPDSYRV